MRNYAKLRKGLYALALAVGSVLIVHGVVTEEELDAYKLVAEALLGLAFFNVDTSGSDEATDVSVEGA